MSVIVSDRVINYIINNYINENDYNLEIINCNSITAVIIFMTCTLQVVEIDF